MTSEDSNGTSAEMLFCTFLFPVAVQSGNNSCSVSQDAQNGPQNMEYLSTASGLLSHFPPTLHKFDIDAYKHQYGVIVYQKLPLTARRNESLQTRSITC